jgi:organic radical activating enzyme
MTEWRTTGRDGRPPFPPDALSRGVQRGAVTTNTTELPFLSNLGLMLTLRCTTACPHCVVEAGPRRKEEIAVDRALEWIDQARSYRDGRIVGLALTGGEPFCDVDKLARVVEYGSRRGFLISVVTNAFWASTDEKACSVLSSLPDIRMVSVSTDVYHLETIPFRNVINVIRACQRLDKIFNIAVCTDDEGDPRYLKIVEDLRALGVGERIRPAITYPVGRAKNLIRTFRHPVSSDAPVAACTMASSPIAFPDGKVLACIGPIVSLPEGHPLFLGNLAHEPLADVLDRAELNPILQIIRVWGPARLVSMLRERGMGELLPRNYIATCLCDVCHKLMSSEALLAALNGMMQDEKLRELVAYARVFYLNETRMAELLQLGEECNQLGPSDRIEQSA